MHRLFHHIDQFGPLIGLFLRLWIAGGHRNTGFAGEDFNRFHKTDILGFFDEIQRVTFGMTAKAIVKPFAVIQMKAGGLFLMERAGCPVIALALIGFFRIPNNLAPDDLRQGHTGAQFIKESVWQAHDWNIGFHPSTRKSGL